MEENFNVFDFTLSEDDVKIIRGRHLNIRASIYYCLSFFAEKIILVEVETHVLELSTIYVQGIFEKII